MEQIAISSATYDARNGIAPRGTTAQQNATRLGGATAYANAHGRHDLAVWLNKDGETSGSQKRGALASLRAFVQDRTAAPETARLEFDVFRQWIKRRGEFNHRRRAARFGLRLMRESWLGWLALGSALFLLTLLVAWPLRARRRTNHALSCARRNCDDEIIQ